MQADRSAETSFGAARRERDLTLFVACYNEQDNIEITLDTLLAALREVDLSWEILIIDDASHDKSVEVIEAYRKRCPGLPISLHVNERNQGLGYNYMQGAALGVGRYYRLICGDNSESKETFLKVFRHIGKADIVIPYHRLCEGKTLLRRTISKAYTVLVNLFSGYRLHYYNGLAVHLRENVLRCPATTQGFGFQAEIMTRLLDQGASYVEIEVTVQERAKGRSKALTARNVSSVSRTLLGVLSRRLKRAFARCSRERPATGELAGRGVSDRHPQPSGR
jgi:glycosyltransferase involved in cell wall biosynthesis